jgi:hypothetical protein
LQEEEQNRRPFATPLSLSLGGTGGMCQAADRGGTFDIYSIRLKRALLLFVVPALVLSGCESAEIDADLRTELLEMARADQEARERLMAVITLGDPESFRTKEAQNAIQEMAAVDDSNQTRLDEIVSQRGWPGAALVGSEGASSALLIIEHSGIDAKKSYLPILRQAVDDGLEEPSQLAKLEDEVSVANTGYQIYGTEISLDTGVPVLVPILDPEGLDARRAEMGLEPMEEHLRNADRNAVAEFGVAVDRSGLSSE